MEHGQAKSDIQKRSESDRSIFKKIFGGIGVIGIAFVLTISRVSPLDSCLTASIYAFAVSIPLSFAWFLIVSRDETWAIFSVSSWHRVLSVIICPFWGFVGIGCFFGHFSCSVGLVFSLASFIGWCLYAGLSAKIIK